MQQKALYKDYGHMSAQDRAGQGLVSHIMHWHSQQPGCNSPPQASASQMASCTDSHLSIVKTPRLIWGKPRSAHAGSTALQGGSHIYVHPPGQCHIPEKRTKMAPPQPAAHPAWNPAQHTPELAAPALLQAHTCGHLDKILLHYRHDCTNPARRRNGRHLLAARGRIQTGPPNKMSPRQPASCPPFTFGNTPDCTQPMAKTPTTAVGCCS